MIPTSRSPSVAALLPLLALAACGDEAKMNSAASASAGTDTKVAAVGGKFGAALQSAAARAASPVKPGGAADAEQPPENGIFKVGEGDGRHKPGDLPKVTIGSDGGEPKVSLAYDLTKEQTQPFQFQIAMGQQGSLPLMVKLHVNPTGELKPADKKDDKKPTEKKDDKKPTEKPTEKKDEKKDDKKPDDKKDEKATPPKAPELPLPPGVTQVPARVDEVVPLGGTLPKDKQAELDKLRGAKLLLHVTKQGLVRPPSLEGAKDAKAEVTDSLLHLGQGIALVTPWLPDKPVGVGAFWMVTDRAIWPGTGIDVVRYRTFKVEGVTKEGVSLSVVTREYATSGRMQAQLDGKIGDVFFDAFDSQGRGNVTLAGGGPFGLLATGGEIGQQTAFRVIIGQKKQKVAQVLGVRIGDQPLPKEPLEDLGAEP